MIDRSKHGSLQTGTRSAVRCVVLFAVFSLQHSALAQGSANETDPCALPGIGSAPGAQACFAARLSAAEAELASVEARYARVVIAASSDPANTRRLVEAEAASWRTYRNAKCELSGETEGGSAGWKTAMTTSCAVEASSARVALLQKQLAGK